MSRALQLRIKTTSERLRTNHIDLLEYTEQLSKENEKLKVDMEKLVRSSSLPLANAFDVETDQQSDTEKTEMMHTIDSLRAEIARLERNLLAAETDKKTLKAKAQLSKPDVDERILNLRARLEEETRLKSEYEARCKQYEMELQTGNENNETLKQELEKIKSESAMALELVNKSMSTKEIEACELDKKLKQIISDMDGMSEYHTKCMDTMMATFMAEIEKHREMQMQQKELIEQLSEELSATRAELDNKTHQSNKIRKGALLAEEGCVPEVVPVPQPPLICPHCMENKKSHQEHDERLKFSGYVQLLEENRLLKVQLAAVTAPRQSSRAQRRPSGSLIS